MKREYPESPIVGVGAVIFKDNKVLLVKRAKEPGKGLWSLPGGALELGESLVDGLKREISEEVSIEIEVGGLVRVLDRILRDQEERVRYHYVIVDYWGWL
ncbi:MAG: NUDIX domain-containing protein, partial [Pseudomonadota bacterium]